MEILTFVGRALKKPLVPPVFIVPFKNSLLTLNGSIRVCSFKFIRRTSTDFTDVRF